MLSHPWVSRPIRARSGMSQVVCILLSVSRNFRLMETVSRSLPAAGLMELIDQAKLALGELETCMPRGRDELPDIRGQPGVYVFYGPDGSALYVGRTRDLFKRIRQHTRASSKDAPFGWLLAREETGQHTNYQPEKSRKALLKNQDFVAAFRRAKNEIASMKVAFVVVRNDTVQCLLEVFATVSLKARFNSFRTT